MKIIHRFLRRPPGIRAKLGQPIPLSVYLLAILCLLPAGIFAQSSSAHYGVTGGISGGGGGSVSSGYEVIGVVPLSGAGTSSSSSYTTTGGLMSWATSALSAVYDGSAAQTVTVADRTLTVAYSGGTGTATGTFHYRYGGHTIYQTAPMTAGSGDNLVYDLPASMLTVRGLEFYFTIERGATVTVGNPDSPYFFRVNLTNAQGQRPTAMPDAQYRIIGLPLNASSPAATSVFPDDLGTVDATQWRLGRYNGSTGEVDEYPSIPTVIPGRGYWLIARNGKRYGSAGITLRPSRTVLGNWYYEVPLDSGWNMVANPWPFDVSFEEMFLFYSGMAYTYHDTLLIENAAHYYNGSGYQSATTIPAWEGFFIFAKRSGVSLLFRYREAINKATAPKIIAEDSLSGGWSLRVNLKSHNFLDSENFLGVRADAKEGADRYDISEPPPAPGGTSLAFKLPGNATRLRTADFRPIFDEGAIWDIRMSDAPDRILTISGLEELSDSWECVLKLENGTTVYLSEGQDVEIPNGVTSAQLIIGSKQYLENEQVTMPDVFSMDQNYPNPFNPSTNIHFVVPVASHIRLEIHNILGQRVRMIVDDDLPKGEYTVTWSGVDDNNESVASGIYFYRISADNFSQCRKMVLLK